MAFGDSYSQLKDDIASWLKRDDLTDEIPYFIRMAELRIYRKLRIRCMETALNGTIASGVVAIPSGYCALKFAYVNGSPTTPLERKDAEWIYSKYPTRSADGKPFYIGREGDNFIFGPYPDSAYTVKGVYYKRLDALSDSNTTNWFTANAPDLLLYASLCEAAPFMLNDERVQLWETKLSVVAERVQREDDEEEFSGSPLAVTAR